MSAPDLGDGEEDRQAFDTNALILPSKRTKVAKVDEAPEEKPMSKRKRRKLDQLAQKKATREMRDDVLTQLKSVQLAPEHLSLLSASQSNVSRRAAADMASRRKALGVPLSDQIRDKLVKRPKRPRLEASESEIEEVQGAGGSSSSSAPVQVYSSLELHHLQGENCQRHRSSSW